MKKTSLLMMWLMLIGFSMANATEVVVGTQESNKLTNWFPTNPFNAYSLSQQIYTASDLGSTSGSITSISFYRDWTSESIDNLEMSGLKLYMKATSKSAFSSNTDMVSVGNDDLVWVGTLSAPSVDYKGWVTINLDKPFQYNPTANLLVCFYDANPSKTATNTNKFYYVPTSGNTALTYFSNDEVPDLNNINSFSGNKQLMGAHNYAKFNISNINLKSIEGNYTVASFPTNTNWRYGLTEQIYTIAEIGGAQTINSLSFHSDVASTRNLDIYLVPTDKEIFDSNEDFISYSNSNKVFSGTVNFLANDWTTINLVIPFNYNGAKNLCLVIDDNTGNYDSGISNFLAYQASNQGLSAVSDGNDITYSNATSNSNYRRSYKSKMRINEGKVIGDFDIALPIYSSWRYGFSQQIYRVEELGYEANSIGSLSFFNTSEEQTRDIDIYLIHTATDVFSSTSNWETVSESEKFFSGEVTFKSGEWTAIGLDRYFDYNGSSNLCVIIDDNTGIAESEPMQFRGYDATGMEGHSIYSNSTNYTPANLNGEAGLLWDKKSQIRFNERGLNFKPSSITVSDITWNGAFVTWESRGTMWNIEYKESSSDTWVPLSEDLEINSYDLTGLLEQATTYDVRVQTNYNGELSSWATAQFTTGEHYARPSDIELVQVTPYTAIIKWKENGDATAWEIWLDNSSTDESATFQADHTTYVLADLTPNADYTVNVRSVIDAEAEEYSFWSYDYYFTTPDANPQPYGLYASKVEPTSATLAWEGTSDTYKIRYRKGPVYSFFEDFESGDLATNGWTTIVNGESNTDLDWQVVNYGSGAYSGNYVARTGAWTGTAAINADNWLISPLTDLSGTLRYWRKCKTSSWPDYYEVLVSTTGNAIADFTDDPVYSETCRNISWDDVTIDLSSYEGQGYIAFHFLNYENEYLYLDDIGIYEYKEPWQEVVTKEQTVTIEGLDPETEYEVELYGANLGQDYVMGSQTTFTTLAKNPAPFDLAVEAGATTADVSWTGYGQMYKVEYRKTEDASFFEDFESADFATKGWTIYTDGGKVSDYEKGWYFSSGSGHNGTNCAASSSWASEGGAIDADNWLITPLINFKDILTYWEYASGSWKENYEVLLSTTGIAEADFTVALRAMAPSTSNSEWTRIDIDLSAYAGQQGYIAFHHKDYDKINLRFDDIKVYDVVSDDPWTTKYVTKPEITLNGLTSGNVYEVQVTSQMSGEPDATSDVFTFTTKAADPVDLVFQHNGNNTDAILANHGRLANVTIEGLYLPDGEWVAVYLPFNVDVASSPFTEARVMTGLETIGSTLIVNFLAPVTTMQAGHPYLVKVDRGDGGNLVDPVFNNVTIQAVAYTDNVSYMYFYTRDYSEFYCSTTYDGYYFLSDFGRKLETLYESCWLKAFQPFFYYDGDYTVFDQILVNTGDGTNDYVTGLNGLKSETDNDVIYNVAGQKLNKTQKGINIVNGKKILVK